MPQQIVRPPQPPRNRTQHFQDNARVARDEIQEILARQDRQTRIFRYRRIRRTAVTVEHRHFAKEIAMTQRSQNHFSSIRIGDSDTDVSPLNNVHCVSGIADPKQIGAGLEFHWMKITKKLLYGGIIERGEERHSAQ